VARRGGVEPQIASRRRGRQKDRHQKNTHRNGETQTKAWKNGTRDGISSGSGSMENQAKVGERNDIGRKKQQRRRKRLLMQA